MNLSAHGIIARLPDHWEGAIVRQSPVDLETARPYGLGAEGPAPPDAGTGPDGSVTVTSLPVVHLANFPLPPSRGDFGSGAVERMRAADAFMAVVEYGRENVGTPLFAGDAIPRSLRLADFHPLALQRPLPGQAGYQEFFTVAGRAFCLYVVLGAASNARSLLAEVNTVLADLRIGPAHD